MLERLQQRGEDPAQDLAKGLRGRDLDGDRQQIGEAADHPIEALGRTQIRDHARDHPFLSPRDRQQRLERGQQHRLEGGALRDRERPERAHPIAGDGSRDQCPGVCGAGSIPRNGERRESVRKASEPIGAIGLERRAGQVVGLPCDEVGKTGPAGRGTRRRPLDGQTVMSLDVLEHHPQ